MTATTQPSDYSPNYVPPMPDFRTYAASGGVKVRAVQLTRENARAVWEWADSKQLFEPAGPKPEDGTVVTGLTIFTTAGRKKADYGDWVVQWPTGGFDRFNAETFAAHYSEVKP